jgi:hypothetical protein
LPGASFDREIVERLAREAEETGVSVSEVIRRALAREALFAQALGEIPEMRQHFKHWLKRR